VAAPAKNCGTHVPFLMIVGPLEDLEQIGNGIAVFHDPANYSKSMTVENPHRNAQSKQTTVKSPEELRSDRELKINAAMDHATQCIVAHMRKQILTRQNGL
jgi:hypothetical protein